MKCVKSISGIIGAIIISTSIFQADASDICTQLKENNDKYEQYFNPAEYVINPEPITNLDGIENVYDENDNRIRKITDTGDVIYLYDDEDRLSVVSGNETVELIYDNPYDFEGCTGFRVGDDVYGLKYDNEIIVGVEDAKGNLICRYQYGLDYVDTIDCATELIVNDDSYIGNLMPLRSIGYVYDVEINCYYLGSGVFYSLNEQDYICGQFEFDDAAYDESVTQNSDLLYSTSSISSSALNSYYTSMLNNTSIWGQVNEVTYASWVSGSRWYDGRNSTELTARCIWAESSQNLQDQNAIAFMIANQVNNAHFPNTVRGTVTRLHNFEVINPAYSSQTSINNSDTWLARQPMPITYDSFKNALYNACVLYFSTTTSDMSGVITKPAGITNLQLSMISINTSSNVSRITKTGNTIKLDGNKITNLAIAGVARVGSTTTAVDINYYNMRSNYVGQNKHLFYRLDPLTGYDL